MLILTLPLHEKGLHSESFFRYKTKTCLMIWLPFIGCSVKGGISLWQLFYVCNSNPKSDGTGATTVIASV